MIIKHINLSSQMTPIFAGSRNLYILIKTRIQAVYIVYATTINELLFELYSSTTFMFFSIEVMHQYHSHRFIQRIYVERLHFDLNSTGTGYIYSPSSIATE